MIGASQGQLASEVRSSEGVSPDGFRNHRGGGGFFILLAEMAIFVGDGAIKAPVPSG